MVQYIYFVKCPECEDEHFDFFDEAKEFAMSCLTKKPIITQIEVERNDFGECTDSCDLGTVWSWEDVMSDVPAEPEATVFSKADTFGCVDCDTCSHANREAEDDPEFAALDNSIDSVDNFRKPIPEGMTVEQLVEEMEENEDEVECKWCGELFDRDDCRYEVDLGYLCDRCQSAIKSRGETLTFREGPELYEKLDIDFDFSNCVDSSDMEIYGVEPIGENIYKAVLLKRFENVRFRGGHDEIEKVEQEMFNIGGLFTFHFRKDGFPELGRWDPELLNNLGNCEIIFDDVRYDQACEKALNGSTSKTEELDSDAVHDLGNEYDGGYPTDKPLLPEFDDETSEVSDHQLALCPECGENTFDHETGICINCGFAV